MRSLVKPKLPPYDGLTWSRLPFGERARLSCQAWALEGYGTPVAVLILYALKVAAYIAGWIFFCSVDGGVGRWDSASWWLAPVAFQKAIAWSMLFEVLGLGCGSGPLTGRYVPPIGGCLYFLRTGTTKLPFFESLPILGGKRRGLIDVALYASLISALSLALLHPAPGFTHWILIAVLVPIIGLADKTVFLAARSEHYWTTIVVFAFAENWIAGAMAIQLALWFFAGFSKLNHHFPTVTCVMASNGPFTPFGWFRRRLYKDYPNDLSPSLAARIKARIGVALELSVPVVLFAGVMLQSQAVLLIGIGLMLLLHGYIVSNVPMGVPIEWNFMVVYGTFFFFVGNSQVTPFDMTSIPVAGFVVVFAYLIPLIGNLKPEWISFLLSMRYYAGNWPVSVWLFRDESFRKLDRLTKSSPWIYDQLNRFYDPRMTMGIISKAMAFRLMHLHGRAFQKLVPLAVHRFEGYDWLDGELIAGLAIGYNFGDGHLHDEQLLRNVQEQCAFDEGELRVIMLESQPLFQSTQVYRIHDAKTGLIERGTVDVKELRSLQPWPTAAP